MKNIVITGASKGIGFELCRDLAQLNHNVYAIARSGEPLSLLEKEFPENITTFPCDLTDTTQIQSFIAAISHIEVDVLINNAGMLINKPFMDLSIQEWNQMMEVNLFSVVKLVKELNPCMKRGSHIVNIGSMGGYQGSSKFPGLSGYSASKGALAILSECLATEFSDQLIAVNCLCLGAVQTDMLAQAFPGYTAPLSASEMSSFIAEFALNGHKYFNGKLLPVALHNPS